MKKLTALLLIFCLMLPFGAVLAQSGASDRLNTARSRIDRSSPHGDSWNDSSKLSVYSINYNAAAEDFDGEWLLVRARLGETICTPDDLGVTPKLVISGTDAAMILDAAQEDSDRVEFIGEFSRGVLRLTERNPLILVSCYPMDTDASVPAASGEEEDPDIEVVYGDAIDQPAVSAAWNVYLLNDGTLRMVYLNTYDDPNFITVYDLNRTEH